MIAKKKEVEQIKTKKVFSAPAILQVGSPTKDGGLRLKVETNELSENEIAMLMKQFNNKFGWILFSANKMNDDNIPEQQADSEGRKMKTPSQRLRATLFVYYTQRIDKSKTFDQFYVEQMEKIIDRFKADLDD